MLKNNNLVILLPERSTRALSDYTRLGNFCVARLLRFRYGVGAAQRTRNDGSVLLQRQGEAGDRQHWAVGLRCPFLQP